MFNKIIFFALFLNVLFLNSFSAAEDYKAPVRTNLSEERGVIQLYSSIVQENRENLKSLNKFIKTNDLFIQMRKKARVSALTNDEREILRETWGKLLSHHIILNNIIDSLNKRNIEDEEDTFANDEYFMIMYAAFLVQYSSAIDFIKLTRKIPGVDIVLDEAVAELNLESGTFDRFKFEYLNVEKFTEYSGYKLQALSRRVISPLNEGIEEDISVISSFHRFKGFYYTVKNGGKIIANFLFKLYFPLQKNISEWMGDERIARGNKFLINQEQIKVIHEKLKAGDILIERREWYLSNIGLPGFWPHAALYLGRPEERSHLENDEAVKEWVREEGVENGSFEELLKTKYPAVYAESLEKDESSHDYRVLEAMSEGVVFTSLEHSANADSLAVLRPKLSNLDVAKSLLTSLKYKGLPYDFNFDFRTDTAVVCSELIYYAYQPTYEKNGLYFPITKTLGRPVVTPNNIIKEFTENYGTPKQQYDLVVFLDGNDKKREAVFSDIEVLKTTWNRPKWFIFTQNKKHKLVNSAD